MVSIESIYSLILRDKMSRSIASSEVVILIKALQRPSKRYGETVCCAGVTLNREWKRLYPVRFRYLESDQKFRRWQRIQFKYRVPTHDRRIESSHIFEDKVTSTGALSAHDRFTLLDPMIVPSASTAAACGSSLALIRPSNTKFRYRKKSETVLEKEVKAYLETSRQQGLLDKELATFTPSPYEFAFSFYDDDGKHTWLCGDWETHATFLKWRSRYGEIESLRQLSGRYNDEYPQKGFVFAIGNMAKRPQTWQLLGVLRLDSTGQIELI
jgi:hypothetical protein